MEDRKEEYVGSVSTVDVRFGGGPIQPGETEADAMRRNRAALNAAIAHIDSVGGGTVFVPEGAGYGYSTYSRGTYPQFPKSISHDVTVIDASRGNTYSNPNDLGELNPSHAPSRDGAQVRWFFHTGSKDGEDETGGHHDGNTFVIDGLWHPNIVITNHLARPASLERSSYNYNKRASLNFGNNGLPVWQVGQGLAPPWNGPGTKTFPNSVWEDDVTSFGIAWAPAHKGTNVLTIFRDASSSLSDYRFLIGWNTTQPESEFHVVARSRHQAGRFIFQSNGGNSDIELRTPSRQRRISLRQDSGEICFTDLSRTENVFVVDSRGNGKFNAGVSGGAIPSSKRPDNCPIGTMVFDTTLGKPIWLKSQGYWVDALGEHQPNPISADE